MTARRAAIFHPDYTITTITKICTRINAKTSSMRQIYLLTAAVMLAASQVQAADPCANKIIRSLPPITYLSEHGGKPRPAINLEVRLENSSKN
jgi:hypothetical protein